MEAAGSWKGHPKGEGEPGYHSEGAGSSLTKLVRARFSAVVLTHPALEVKSAPNRIGFLGHKPKEINNHSRHSEKCTASLEKRREFLPAPPGPSQGQACKQMDMKALFV